MLNETEDLPFDIYSLHRCERRGAEPPGRPHKQTHFEIVWVQEGSGMHIVDKMKYPVSDNTIFCVAPGQQHQFRTDPETKGYVLSFSAPFLGHGEYDFDGVYDSGLFYLLSRSPGILISKDISEEMLELAKKMMRESRNYFLLRTEILRRYLKIFLIHLARQLEGRDAAAKSGENGNGVMQKTLLAEQQKNVLLMKRFSVLLERFFREKRTVTEYAGQLSVTPSHLNYVVKKTSGYSAGYHIRQRIVEEAKRRAVYSDYSMKEIAYQLGFEDTAHFSKFFKNVSGDNFSEFRKKTSCHYF